MRHSVVEMTRAARRRLKRVVRKSREKDYGRPAFAVLHLLGDAGQHRRGRSSSESRAFLGLPMAVVVRDLR